MDMLRKYLQEAMGGETLKGGNIDLYHFCTTHDCLSRPETLVITPGQMSSVEAQRSSVPRSYFYPHSPLHALRDVPRLRNGALYHVQYPASQIYDTTNTRDQWANEYGFIDQDKMFNDIRKRFSAAFLPGKAFPAVILFEPITAKLIDNETKRNMLKKVA